MSGADTDDQRDLALAADAYVRKTFRPNDLVAAVVGAIPLAG
jgi:CheY-like chemotaxis protein